MTAGVQKTNQNTQKVKLLMNAFDLDMTSKALASMPLTKLSCAPTLSEIDTKTASLLTATLDNLEGGSTTITIRQLHTFSPFFW